MAMDETLGGGVSIDTVDFKSITAFNDYSMAIAKNPVYFISETSKTNEQSVLTEGAVMYKQIGTYLQNDNITKSVGNIIGSFSLLQSMWSNDVENPTALDAGTTPTQGTGVNGTGVTIQNWSKTGYTGPWFAPVQGEVWSYDGAHNSIAEGNWGTTRTTGYHGGLDIYAVRGAPIVAVVSGLLEVCSWSDASETGNRFQLKGDDGYVYWGCHLDEVVKGIEGCKVFAGQKIGTVGSSGYTGSTGPHLHLEVQPGPGRGNQSMALNPYPLINAVYPDGHNPVQVQVSGTTR
jgi:murein DD-endopeptidase MepM/ murein hydrolase activator NlpD